MSNDKTAETLHQPFVTAVLARLEEVSERLARLEKQNSELDWGRLLTEFKDMHDTFETYFKSFDRKLDVINSEFLEMKANYRLIEDRVAKLEADVGYGSYN